MFARGAGPNNGEHNSSQALAVGVSLPELANAIAWDAVGAQIEPYLANMRNGSAVVVWPWDAVP